MNSALLSLIPLAGAVLVAQAVADRSLRPRHAALMWLASLMGRALIIAGLAATATLALAGTDVFRSLTRWCLHSAVPGIAAHLSVAGHDFGDVASALPSMLVVGALVWTFAAVARSAGALGRSIRSDTLEGGPGGSLVFASPDVVLVTTGFVKPRVLVSTGALLGLDDAELAAGLAHERGHIRGGHHVLLLAAQLCAAIARPVPGTGHALSRLAFCLERDADEYALSRDHDPRTLAAAICKSVRPGPSNRAPLRPGTQAAQRVRMLLEHAALRPATRLRVTIPLLVGGFLIATVAIAAAGLASPDHGPVALNCPG